MLKSLHIENIAVIKSLDLDFESGFSVLSGETGAGKSILIDSLNLLLGGRISRELIRSGENTATVQALFSDLKEETQKELEELGFSPEDGELYLSKTISQDGKSVTKLNGRTITNALQKEISSLLVNIHGQNDNQKILQKAYHLAILDEYGGYSDSLSAYETAYEEYSDVKKQLKQLSHDESEKLRLTDLYTYQLAEIDAVHLQPGEEELLKKDAEHLSNLEAINHYADLSFRLLSGGEKAGAVDYLKKAVSTLENLGKLTGGTENLITRLENDISDIVDVAEYAKDLGDFTVSDPSREIDKIEERLETIRKIEKKYGAEIEDVLQYRKEIAEKLQNLTDSENKREELTLLLAEKEKTLTEQANILSQKRKDAGMQLQKSVEENLTELDMPKVKFAVGIAESDPCETGKDDVEFLVSTNVGEPLQPMIRIASGGELSRIMLALRSVLNEKYGTDTVIFDEIDTGISGKTSRKVGIKMKEIGKKVQVITVTHSAQIASLSDHQYLISKAEKNGRAETSVKLLTFDERVEEIARILGGLSITETQRKAAKEMLTEGGL